MEKIAKFLLLKNILTENDNRKRKCPLYHV